MFKDIVEITDSDIVRMAKGFDELLNKELCLGQTRFVCRHGTLSDGHDKVTNSQRYYQAIKEMYTLAQEMSLKKVIAMRAQADLMDAEQKRKTISKASDELRCEADILEAKTRLHGALISLKDQHRMIDEYNKVRLELQDEVRAKYPEGIEQAEPHDWLAVGEYWAAKKAMGALSNPLTHIPLEPEQKAWLGTQTNMPELAAAFLVNNKDVIKSKFKGDSMKFLESKFGKKMIG